MERFPSGGGGVALWLKSWADSQTVTGSNPQRRDLWIITIVPSWQTLNPYLSLWFNVVRLWKRFPLALVINQVLSGIQTWCKFMLLFSVIFLTESILYVVDEKHGRKVCKTPHTALTSSLHSSWAENLSLKRKINIWRVMKFKDRIMISGKYSWERQEKYMNSGSQMLI